MNYSDYRFTLDVQIHQSQVSVPVTLGDSARRLCIGLTDGRKPYTIEDGCRAVFNAKKPDGSTIKNDCIIERNTILYEFTEQTTNAEGVVNCDITIYDTDGKVLTSPQFIIVVDKRAVRDGEVPLSESESTTLDRIITSEQDRQDTFVANEAARQDAFNTAEAERKAIFDKFDVAQVPGDSTTQTMSQKAVTDAFDNQAIKGSASGEGMLCIADISPLTHNINVKLSSADAVVYRSGKNLVPFPYAYKTTTQRGITFTDNGDGSLTVNGTNDGTGTSNFYFYLNEKEAGLFLPKGTYIASGIDAIGKNNWYFQGKTVAGAYPAFHNNNVSYAEPTEFISLYLVIKSGVTVNNAVIRPMLTLVGESTEYELGVAFAKYTPNSDGNVKVSSFYPSTRIFTANGVVIDAEYNRDINKVINQNDLKGVMTTEGTPWEE